MPGKILPTNQQKISFIVEKNQITGAIKDDIYFSLQDIFMSPELHNLYHVYENKIKGVK